MEIRTYLGTKPDRLDFQVENGDIDLKTKLTPQLCLDTPIMFSAMSYGAISLNLMNLWRVQQPNVAHT